MTKWLERKLSELGKITTGKTPPSSQPKFYGGNIPFVTPADMDIRRTIDTTARYLTNAGALNVKSSFINKPAVCVSCIGSVGKTVLVDQPFVSNQQINSIVVHEYVERLFVYYNLLGRKDEIRLKASGSVQPIINKADFGRLTVRIPDQPTQKRIAKVLGSLDDKIELNRRMNETLEEIARALFRDWFIDFGPTRRQMDGATDPAAIMGHAFPDYKAAALAPLFPARLGENGLPEGWGEKPVSNYGKLKGGKQLPKTEFVQDGEFPVFGGAGHMGQTDKFNAEGYVITVGRVGAYCGEFVAHRGKAWVNNNASVFKLQLCTQREWFFLALRELDLEPIKKGAAQPFVSNSDINELTLIEPGFDVREETNEVLATFLRKIEVNRKENQTLTEMRDFLLPKLMRGEIRLQDEKTQK